MNAFSSSLRARREPAKPRVFTEMWPTVSLLAKTEGILLDPVYTGKAVAGLIDLSHRGYFKKGENVLFLHTGGSPALYAYVRPLLGLEEVAD